MKFSIKDFFSKCDQIHRKLRICSHILKESLMKVFIFCAVLKTTNLMKPKLCMIRPWFLQLRLQRLQCITFPQ